MLFKSVLSIAVVLACSAVEVSAHAAINPALGVDGTASRDDVQRPSNNNPCGNTDLSAIDSSTAVTADASGSFTVEVENFNGGQDGSRSVSLQVDASGTGDDFVDGEVTTDGDGNPNDTGTEEITASLPEGTACTGGTSGDLCLASFTTTAGFGNCVVVQQSAGGAGNAGNAGNAAAEDNANADDNAAADDNANANDNATADDNANNNANANNNGNGNGNANANGNNGNGNGRGNRNGRNRNNNNNNKRAAGTRLARHVAAL